jgi:flagellar biosynthesis protein FlhG
MVSIMESPQTVTTNSQQHIIAIGGAKGGVGKSLIAANIGVYLASQGHRTVLMDLDLGAANLHLYLGVWALRHRINDYLDKKVDDLESIAVETEHGLSIIGGGSSRLGSANLPYTQKLKLIRAIRRMDADYIILDLGGDTSYNILDFFLLSQTGMVLTTCDPAAYLDAYTFIKMALYRRLARLFGAESVYRRFKDERLQGIIRSFVGPADDQSPRHVTDLLNQISRHAPEGRELVERAVAEFQPKLIVNMVQSNREVRDLIQRMQAVSTRMLSVPIDCVGKLAVDPDIARSTHDLIPEVARHPNGAMAQCIAEMLQRLPGLVKEHA